MIALLQRVTQASVTVNKKCIAEIESGLLVFVAIEKGDNEAQVSRLVERVLQYRIFSDSMDKMNLNVTEVNGGVLLVPQFTLAANTQKGNRPSFTSAAAPQDSLVLFNLFIEITKQKYNNIATGEFGADMKVALVNDGPVTFYLQVRS